MTECTRVQGGFYSGEEDGVSVDVEVELNDNIGDINIALRVDTDDAEIPSTCLYLPPVDAVIIGERLISLGRRAIEEMTSENPDAA